MNSNYQNFDNPNINKNQNQYLNQYPPNFSPGVNTNHIQDNNQCNETENKRLLSNQPTNYQNYPDYTQNNQPNQNIYNNQITPTNNVYNPYYNPANQIPNQNQNYPQNCNNFNEQQMAYPVTGMNSNQIEQEEHNVEITLPEGVKVCMIVTSIACFVVFLILLLVR